MRCYGCMKEYDSSTTDICPHCGYKVGTRPNQSNYLEPGITVSGRYLIGRALGSGGFGITYIGWDCRNNKTVTIKEYLPGVFAYRVPGQNAVACYDRDCSDKFHLGIAKTLEESNCIARFNSDPGIVDVYNCVEENGTVYIILEYLEGRTLKEVLEEKGTYTFEEAIEIIKQVLTTLSHVHQSDIIHRDISPDNIFLCNDGSIKLIDFGAARTAYEDDHKSLSVILKRGYAPKEQYSGHTLQGPWTDVYATAATLYRMLTGVVPQESLERDVEDNLVSVKEMGIDIPDHADHAITRALAIKAADRTKYASEFLEQLLDPEKDIPLEPVKAEEPKTIEVAPPASRSVPEEPEPEDDPTPEKGGSKKKLIAIIAAVVVLLVAGALIASHFISGGSGEVVDSGKCGEKVSWSLDSNGLIVISGEGQMDNYSNYTEVPWCSRVGEIKSLAVSDGVTSVGNRAFYACDSLKEANISESVRSVGDYSFFGCTSLDNMILPSSVTSLGAHAFSNCINMKYLHIPTTVDAFGIEILSGSNAYICCDEDTGDAKTYAELNGIIFSRCDASHERPSIDLPVSTTPDGSVLPTVSVASITANGFCGPKAVWVLTAEGELQITGEGNMDPTWAVDEKTNGWVVGAAPEWEKVKDSIKTVTVSAGITDIGANAFRNCTSITKVTLPEGLTSIGAGAFMGCSGISSLAVPASVASIGDTAFRSCTNLRTIELPGPVKKLGDYTFAGCKSLIKLTLPDTLTAIGNYAFSDCAALAAVEMPPALKSLGNYSFSTCSSLHELTLPAGIKELPYAVFSGSGLISFSIPYGVKNVCDYAFSGCNDLLNITIPASVEAVGQGAFANCPLIKSIVLPSSVTTVGMYAFSGCPSLTFVHFPTNTKNIGNAILENSPNAVICCDNLFSPARTYALKNGINNEHCNGRH